MQATTTIRNQEVADKLEFSRLPTLVEAIQDDALVLVELAQQNNITESYAALSRNIYGRINIDMCKMSNGWLVEHYMEDDVLPFAKTIVTA